MNQTASQSPRIARTSLAIVLLIAVVAGTSCRPEPDQPAPKPQAVVPLAPEPAVQTPVAETPPLDVSSEMGKPTSDPGETEHPDAAEPAEPDEQSQTPDPDMAENADEDPSLADPNAALDFGEPLVDGLTDNERLDREQPVWLTRDRKSVVIQSMVCQRQAPLEMFACLLRSKEHESVLAVPVKAYIVHTGLLLAEALPGTPVRWTPEYAPPTGTEIEITVLWKDEQGKVQKARAQDWVRDMTTGKAMTQPWVFAGSMMIKDEESRKEYYAGDTSGDLICVSNFSSATLDVPIRSSDSNASLMFEAFTENIPPLGTPVTMVLTPKLSDSADSAPAADQATPEANEAAGQVE